MRLKSYFASSVEQAIERARVELGADAMLLNSRRVTGGGPASALGEFEVVFGVTGEALQRKPASPLPGLSIADLRDAKAQSAASPVASDERPADSHPGPSTPAKQGRTKPRSEGKASASPKQVSAKKPRPVANKSVGKGKSQTELSGLADQLAELRKEIQSVQTSLRAPYPLPARDTSDVGTSHSGVHQQLMDFDFSHQTARSLLEAALRAQAEHGLKAAASPLEHTLIEQINLRFAVSPTVGSKAGLEGANTRRIAMLVGPPGVGKTTTLVKLAIRLGIERRIPVQLLSLDTMRVGCAEQLAEYARIIGADFRAVYTAASLDDVLTACPHKKLVLIDTPGYSPAELAEAQEAASFLRNHPEIDVQLVLPASLRISALERFSERFAVFSPTKLLFTHLDEVETFGPTIEHAMNTQLPVSYLASGQSIPNDIEEASKARLTAELFALEQRAAVSAA